MPQYALKTHELRAACTRAEFRAAVEKARELGVSLPEFVRRAVRDA